MKKSNSEGTSSYSLKYVSFKDEDESFPYRSDSEEPEDPSSSMACSSKVEMSEDGPVYTAKDWSALEENQSSNSGNGSLKPKRIRLRPVETESDYFLKLMNRDLMKILILIQLIASIAIIIFQLIHYATIPRDSGQMVTDIIGIGLWGPVLIFGPTCWLTFATTRSPTGCTVGIAMACQIIAILVSLVLLIVSSIDLVHRVYFSHWSYCENGEVKYSPVPSKVFCSFIILSSMCMVVSAIITSMQYCKITCCGKANGNDESFVFDVEAVKI